MHVAREFLNAGQSCCCDPMKSIDEDTSPIDVKNDERREFDSSCHILGIRLCHNHVHFQPGLHRVIEFDATYREKFGHGCTTPGQARVIRRGCCLGACRGAGDDFAACSLRAFRSASQTEHSPSVFSGTALGAAATAAAGSVTMDESFAGAAATGTSGTGSFEGSSTVMSRIEHDRVPLVAIMH